ncbi:MAG: short-chain dehydrogenase [Legionellales bacterium]|nr:short-chain dehydrogenase [Legionellales bacterium]
MSKVSVVTGAGSGIGRALSVLMAENDHTVIAIGRREQPLQQLKNHYPKRVQIIPADVSKPENRDAIASVISKYSNIDYLVHNAGVLEPVAELRDVDLHDWRAHMAINVEAPLFLTQALLPQLAGGRILHISSGAAHRPIHGWGAYCTSKAAFYMLFQCLREELQSFNIGIGSVRPGVVDTPIQDRIRQLDEAVFPALKDFQDLKEYNKLIPPATCALFLYWILTMTDAENFTREEWDIYDTSHHHHWLDGQDMVDISR